MSSIAKVFITKNKTDRTKQKLKINKLDLYKHISVNETLKWVLSVPERNPVAAFPIISRLPKESLKELTIKLLKLRPCIYYRIMSAKAIETIFNAYSPSSQSQ